MDKRKFVKKLEKNLGMNKIRTQIRAISFMFVFLVIGAVFTRPVGIAGHFAVLHRCSGIGSDPEAVQDEPFGSVAFLWYRDSGNIDAHPCYVYFI